jgi:hypothetical protein
MFSTESIPKRLKVPFPRKWLVLKQCHLLKRNAPFFQGTLRPLNESVCWKKCSCQLILLWFTLREKNARFECVFLFFTFDWCNISPQNLRQFYLSCCQDVFEVTLVRKFLSSRLKYYCFLFLGFSRRKLQNLKVSLKGIAHSVTATPS